MWNPFCRAIRWKALLPPAIGMAAIGFVIGCQPAAPAQTQTHTVARLSARVVDLQAIDYSFSTPSTLPAGLVTIRLTNNGQEAHHGQLLRLNAGVTFDQFTSALQTDNQAALRLASLAGGPGTIDPNGTSEVTLDLEPGEYALACFIAGPDGLPHVAKGMLKPIQVTRADQVPPLGALETSATFTMKDFAFDDLPGTLAAGKATYKVVNAGPQAHEMNVLKLAPGKTAADALAWNAAPSGPPPFAFVGGINALGPGGSGYMILDLQPGSYVAMCHVPDPDTGLPHVELGMIRSFTVPD